MLLLPWHTQAEAGPQLTDSFASVELRLPARPSELRRARDCVADAGAGFGLDRKACYELVFAVNEAVTNAIRHGSPAQDGTIGLRIDSDGDALVCLVSDCGPFTTRDQDRDSSFEEGGRGFAFMSAMTDELELTVEPDRTIIELRKRRLIGAVLGHA
ncbi:MAG: ATP-binding protein [Actinomycetota bacterium]|nr:ATP-binding protein [Actinomycetota bacterium]